MKGLVFVNFAACTGVAVAYVQGASVSLSLEPATTTVAASGVSSGPLFHYETVQLTNDVLTNVTTAIQNNSISSLFAFGANSTSSTGSKRNWRSCKILPGDSLWPDDTVWNIFNALLGGRLIKAAPLAASCYEDWPEYNPAQCSTITSDWLISNLQ